MAPVSAAQAEGRPNLSGGLSGKSRPISDESALGGGGAAVLAGHVLVWAALEPLQWAGSGQEEPRARMGRVAFDWLSQFQFQAQLQSGCGALSAACVTSARIE